jgi:hypothetical protein
MTSGCVITRVLVYRNDQGEVFYRLSPTRGRTSVYQLEAAEAADLDRWLLGNGYAQVV